MRRTSPFEFLLPQKIRNCARS